MPSGSNSVKIKSSSGSIHINYTISTPRQPNASKIDPLLPTIIFIHPVYIAQSLYQPQFGDPALRRFNLIALDSRCHGDTTGTAGKEWGRKEAAEDVSKFMDALKLPPSFFCGVSMGACIAQQLAMLHPKKALGLFLISPLPVVEPADVAEGRQEVWDYWMEGFKGGSKNIDEPALMDSVYGALQLGFNGAQTSLISALVTRTVPQLMKQWTPKRFDEGHRASVAFIVNRAAFRRDEYTAIACPVHLVHCAQDVAYPFGVMEEIHQNMTVAGVKVKPIDVIPGAPHFGSVTHYHLINPMLERFLLQNISNPPPPAQSHVVSPFEAILVKSGWVMDESDDEFVV